jgi:hypothetical protein
MMRMMEDDRFTKVVRGQADARVDGDNLTFMGYVLPNTRVAGGGPARSYELIEAKVDGDEGMSAVRYIGPSGAGSYVLKQKWRRVDEAWRVVSMERPADMVESPSAWYQVIGVFKKIYNFGPKPSGGGRRGR